MDDLVVDPSTSRMLSERSTFEPDALQRQKFERNAVSYQADLAVSVQRVRFTDLSRLSMRRIPPERESECIVLFCTEQILHYKNENLSSHSASFSLFISKSNDVCAHKMSFKGL